ncbi:MAG TPA: hypothetical protein VIP11_16405 [Gemmatimonadaceae bacterium]
MRRSIASLIAVVVVAVFLVSCSDRASRDASPTSPGGGRFNSTPAACVTLNQLVSLVNDVFGAGSPNANSALGKLDNLDKQLQKGNLADAQDQARNIVAFVQQKAQQGGLPGTHAQVQALISGVLCYVGLSPDTFLIFPSDAAQVVKHSGGRTGISLQANTVAVPTLVTITVLTETTPPLVTKLDQYPGYISITQSSPLTKPAVVGVCPSASVPANVLARLRLGHQATSGFEITPAADASFLDCSTSTAQSGKRGWLQRLASVFTPKPLYAATMFGGGVGGTVTEFSPFAPVDAFLSFGGGVGGTVTEFKAQPSDSLSPTPRLPKTPVDMPNLSRAPDARVNTVVNGVCTQIDAIVGMSVETECRPVVTLKTFQGTILQNVPVNWIIGQGGGVVAPEATTAHTCGAFGSSASTSTNTNGSASVCWTLGATTGNNTVISTPSAGGDAPAGVTFSPASITFTAVAMQITPTATATGGVFTYDALAHAGSGTCSHGLTPALTYSGGATPTNAGTYTLTVTCGAGNPLYVTVTQTATIQINPAATTTTVSCPASVVYTGAARTPCTAAATGPGLNQSLTPTYTSNVNAGTATASATYAGGGNYAGSTGSATFQIAPASTTAAVSCPASVAYTGSPVTPCTGSVTGPGLSMSVTPTYTSNVVGTATATVNYAGGGNYLSSTASKTFQISYVQVGCFSSPIYNVMPTTKSFQNKGSNVPVKCALVTASGTGVTNATGDLLVQDMGTDGQATPIPVFSLANAFKSSGSGNYAYGLDTSPAGFVSKHYYFVTATWSDGSKTTGWFYIK